MPTVAPVEIIKSVHLSFTSGTSNKVWAGYVLRDGGADLYQFVSAWGRRYGPIQHKRRALTTSHMVAEDEYEAALNNKFNHGYVVVNTALNTALPAFVKLEQELRNQPLSSPVVAKVAADALLKVSTIAASACAFCQAMKVYEAASDKTTVIPPPCNCSHTLLQSHQQRRNMDGGLVDHHHACLKCACLAYTPKPVPVAECDFCTWERNFSKNRGGFLHELCTCGHGAFDAHAQRHANGHGCTKTGCPCKEYTRTHGAPRLWSQVAAQPKPIQQGGGR